MCATLKKIRLLLQVKEMPKISKKCQNSARLLMSKNVLNFVSIIIFSFDFTFIFKISLLLFMLMTKKVNIFRMRSLNLVHCAYEAARSLKFLIWTTSLYFLTRTRSLIVFDKNVFKTCMGR